MTSAARVTRGLGKIDQASYSTESAISTLNASSLSSFPLPLPPPFSNDDRLRARTFAALVQLCALDSSVGAVVWAASDKPASAEGGAAGSLLRHTLEISCCSGSSSRPGDVKVRTTRRDPHPLPLFPVPRFTVSGAVQN